MTASLSAEGGPRQLVLQSGGIRHCVISLDQGLCRRLLVPDDDGAVKVLTVLEAVPEVAVLPADGGVVGHLTVAENLWLALRYGRSREEASSLHWESLLQRTLGRCGWSVRQQRDWLHQPVGALDALERWRAGVLRHVLSPPELLVLDRVFLGRGRQQANVVLAMCSFLRQLHPFRTLLFLDVDTHEVPALDDCVSPLHLPVGRDDVFAAIE